LQRSFEVVPKHRIISLHSGQSADHHMVGARKTVIRKDFAGEGAEAALDAVADDRIPDLLGDGEADALRFVTIGAIADEQDEARGRRSPASIGSEEIGAFSKRD
jgi:hypothetical protein